ncbi:MAG TPA: LCP family protein [Mycobacteriales bacterium]|nr:LCP family protein [Mycobacteriales bacterium]
MTGGTGGGPDERGTPGADGRPASSGERPPLPRPVRPARTEPPRRRPRPAEERTTALPAAGGTGGTDSADSADSRTAALPSPSPVPAVPPAARHAAPAAVLPAHPHRSRGRRVARALSWVATATSLVLLLTAGAGWALLQKYDGNINRISGVLDGEPVPEGGPRTILIVGSDSREGLAPGEDFQGVGDEFVTGQRSDTIILAHLYGDDDVAQLVSFPRDSWVTIPEYTDPATGEVVPAHEAKINAAFFEGGPALLVDTVEELSGLEIDHYVQVDFTGFQDMVDALGGVEVCLSEPQREPKSGIDLPAGRSVVEGEQALAFVRQRSGLARGDIDRIARQQQFMGAIVRKTLSAGTLANPFKLNGFLEAATQSLQVDEGLTIGGLRDLALRLRGFDSGGVVFSTVPVADPAARRQGQSVVLLDLPAAEALFDGLRRDVPPGKAEPEQPADAPEIVVAPQDVRVQVFNGAGVRGLAARVAQDLQDVGFAVVGPPENRGSGRSQTVVLHGPAKADSARTLAAALPGAVVELDRTLGNTLQVVAGSGYSGAVEVAVGQPAPSAPAAPPAAPPDSTTAAQDPCAA